MNITTATPLEIDTALSGLYTVRSRAYARLDDIVDSMHRLIPDTKTNRWSRHAEWLMSDAEAVRAVELLPLATDLVWRSNDAKELTAKHTAALEAIVTVNGKISDLNDEWIARGRWTRAFLVVTNGTGHVHSSMNCSTCYPTTQFVWMVDYAAKDEAEIIAAAGERACSICYPNAPVDLISRPSRMFTPDEIAAKAAREVRAAEKAARDAKRIAKGLTADGSEFMVVTGQGSRDHEFFKTEAAASQWAVHHLANKKAYGYSISEDTQAGIDTVVRAMSQKHGVGVQEIMAEIDRKVAAKIKRDARNRW